MRRKLRDLSCSLFFETGTQMYVPELKQLTGSHKEESPRVAEKGKGDGILSTRSGWKPQMLSSRGNVNLHLPKPL